MYLLHIIILIYLINIINSLQTIDELCENLPIGTKIPHPEDCNLYLKCTRDNDKTFAMVISCQNGLFFNPNTLECDPDYESEICKKPTTKSTRKPKKTTPQKPETTTKTTKGIQSTIKTTITKITTTDPKIIICPEEDNIKVKFLKSYDDCSKYYMCYHGKALPLKCWNGLHFSTKYMQCTPPEIAKCEYNNVQYPECPKFGKAVIPHPDECRYFFYCFNGVRTIQQCGSFDHWDLIDRKCKRKNQAICYSEQEANKRKRF